WITPVGYLLFYLSAVVVSILPTYLAHRRDPNYRSLGASGGVSAVLFAYILFDPWSKLIIFPIPVPVPAFVFALLYVGYSIWMDRRGRDNVNHSAHLWGAAYGVLFTVLLRPRVLGHFTQALFGCRRSPPRPFRNPGGQDEHDPPRRRPPPLRHRG